MTMEEVQQELAELNGQIDATDDPREGYALVRQKIEQHREAGHTVPEELVRLEKAMQVECLSESQGR